eukprot:scaffold41711_cov81-Phaeocystis_antarctica.AAC.2
MVALSASRSRAPMATRNAASAASEGGGEGGGRGSLLLPAADCAGSGASCARVLPLALAFDLPLLAAAGGAASSASSAASAALASSSAPRRSATSRAFMVLLNACLSRSNGWRRPRRCKANLSYRGELSHRRRAVVYTHRWWWRLERRPRCAATGRRRGDHSSRLGAVVSVRGCRWRRERRPRRAATGRRRGDPCRRRGAVAPDRNHPAPSRSRRPPPLPALLPGRPPPRLRTAAHPRCRLRSGWARRRVAPEHPMPPHLCKAEWCQFERVHRGSGVQGSGPWACARRTRQANVLLSACWSSWS